MANPIETFFIPLAKLKGVLKSDNTINQSSPYISDVKTSKSKLSNNKVPKKKYASIGKSQMRSGRSSTIKTSSYGVLNKLETKKKTLLGS